MYDSLAGPSLSLRPEELDRLDASELDSPPGHLRGQVHDRDPPSIDIDTLHYRNLEASIDRYVKSYGVRYGADDGSGNAQGTVHSSGRYLSGNRDTDNVFMYNERAPSASAGRDLAYYHGKDTAVAAGPFSGKRNAPHEPTGATTMTAAPIHHQNNAILTPPSSAGQPNLQHGEKGSLLDMLGTERDKAILEMQRICDRRIEASQKGETEHIQRLEADYRQQLSKLQQDLDSMLHQHQQVIKLKNEVERGLQLELDVTRRELRREREGRQAEKERLQRNIKELHEKIRELERKVASLNRVRQKKKRSVTFRDYADDDDEADGGDLQSARLARATVEEYEDKISKMRMEHDAKIATLVRHFEKEKAAALEILRSKVRAEVNLLVPRIKEQCLRAYATKVRGLKEEIAGRLRAEFEAKMRRLGEEQAVARRLWQRQTRELVERERQEASQRLRAKYELRLMEVRNECERRILQRLGAARRGSVRDPSEAYLAHDHDEYGDEGEATASLASTEDSLADLSFV